MSVKKEANALPIPDYRLIEPLGKGGCGEVWKCEAPGGLFKAIKFVFGNVNGLDSVAEHELQAIHRIKAIRHPYLLSMDRIECIDGELIIVMELADQNLEQRWEQCRTAGKPGIPRPELLRYLREASEVLDLMSREYQLQHLDIKPHNLFVVSKHAKVGDFGIVTRLHGANSAKPMELSGPITPIYASPEVFRGQPSRFSDQYSLAIVYQQLLTGCLPFQGKNARQLMLMHSTQEPDLDGLDPADRQVVARALAKEPERRFASCMEFVAALYGQKVSAAAAQFGARATLPSSAAPPRAAEPSAVGPSADSSPGSQPSAVFSGAAKTLTDMSIDTKPTQTGPAPSAAPAAIDACAGYRTNLTKVMREIMSTLGKTSAQDLGLAAPSLTHAKDAMRYKFRVGLSIGAACAKLDSFCAQSYGSMTREDERGRGFTVPLPSNSQARLSGRHRALDVQVILDSVQSTAQALASAPTPVHIEVAAEMRAIGCTKQSAARLLREMGLPLLDSLRAHLLVQANSPAQERFPWSRPMLVRTVYPDGSQGQPIACMSKDLSLSGIGFIVPCELDATEVLIDFPSTTHPPALTVPGTLRRARLRPDGGYEVGALFRLPLWGPAPVANR